MSLLKLLTKFFAFYSISVLPMISTRIKYDYNSNCPHKQRANSLMVELLHSMVQHVTANYRRRSHVEVSFWD